MKTNAQIATELDRAAEALFATLPTNHTNETREAYQRRMAIAQAREAMQEAARTLRGERAPTEAEIDDLFGGRVA